MAVIENARIATITPTTPNISAFFAVLILAGSPCAVKNIMPAITKNIMESPTKIFQVISNIFMIKPDIVIAVWAGYSANPKDISGKINNPNKTKDNNFLSIKT